MNTYFFDTYAFFEILRGNQSYEKYSKDISIITTRLNLMELHNGLLIQHGKEVAEIYYRKYLEFAAEINDDVIMEASELKAKYNKRNISYIDCIGYVISKHMNIKFLTGDKQFADMDNVEYVK
jgi:uncharacterized protein